MDIKKISRHFSTMSNQKRFRLTWFCQRGFYVTVLSKNIVLAPDMILLKKISES